MIGFNFKMLLRTFYNGQTIYKPQFVLKCQLSSRNPLNDCIIIIHIIVNSVKDSFVTRFRYFAINIFSKP